VWKLSPFCGKAACKHYKESHRFILVDIGAVELPNELDRCASVAAPIIDDRAAPEDEQGRPDQLLRRGLGRPGSPQVSSRCLVDDGFHARSRRAGPLHRWVMDDAATAELLPARSSLAGRRDARRAPAVQHVSRWTYHLDVS
jgi:hypothetical protein